MVKNLQLVIFTVGKEHYGVGIDAIQEIVRVPEITEVPDAPVFLEGVINLRGRVVPVLDLRKRLRLPGMEKTKTSRVLVIENEGNLTGLLVDAVSEVRKVQPDAVEDPPEMISAIGIEYITGVVKMEDLLIILLNLRSILSIEDMNKIQNTLEPAPESQAA
jgi:purine-binding chemotaxis protein CheW